MLRRPSYPVAVTLLALLYFATAKLGLLAAVAHGFISSAWPPAGIALAALLLGGVRLWPGIAAAAFLVNATAGLPILPSIGLSIGNTAEAVVGALVLLHIAHFRSTLERLQDVFALGAVSALGAAVGAAVGIGTLWASGVIASTSLAQLYFVWWSGDAMGTLVVAPVLLTWLTGPPPRAAPLRTLEASALFLMLVALATFLFQMPFSYVYAIFPLTSWAALRFGPRGASTASLLVSGLAIWYTLHGQGPFAASDPAHDLALLQTFIGLLTLTARLLAARTSERNAAAGALMKSEANYRLLFERNPNILFVYDLETLGFLAVNEAALQHYGYTRGEFLAMNLQDIRPPEELARLREGLNKAGEGLYQAGEWRHRKKCGAIINVEITRHTLAFAGRPAALAMAQDITRRKVLESQLLQAQKMEAVGRLAGGIAHDFNNLLTATLACCDLLNQELKSHSNGSQDLIGEIRAATQRAAALTSQLLAFSRKQILQPKLLDVDAVLTDLERLLRRLIREDVAIELVLDGEPKPVFADPIQLEQVIINLALNARDSMPLGGSLLIETAVRIIGDPEARELGLARAGKLVAVTVRDTGSGMSAETVRHIFDPFFTTKEQGKGTGLGLAMVDGFVRQSGGAVEVQSEPGKGSSFTILLPWERRSDPVRRMASLPASRPTRGTETILLVDDEASLCQTLGRFLNAQGYKVLTAGDSVEALRIGELHRGHIDLLLTDVVLPGPSGMELASALPQSQPGLRVLYMSGHTESDLLRRGVSSETLAFLAKPFSLAELGGAVRGALDASA